MITQSEILRYLNIAVKLWVTATAYKPGQYVNNSGVIYECLVEHTSGTFATDLNTNLYWSAETIALRCVNHAISQVNGYCNRDFRGGSYTDEFIASISNCADSGTKYYTKNAPLNSVTSIEYFDENTSEYITIFASGDTISNSVKIMPGGILQLYNGYTFTTGTIYRIIYNGGYASYTEWVTGAVYQVGNYVINNGNKYVCLTAHTAGTFATDLAAAKWELSTVEYIPYDVKMVCTEIAAWSFKKSYASGAGLLGVSSNNLGGQSSQGTGFDPANLTTEHEKLLNKYRFINV